MWFNCSGSSLAFLLIPRVDRLVCNFCLQFLRTSWYNSVTTTATAVRRNPPPCGSSRKSFCHAVKNYYHHRRHQNDGALKKTCSALHGFSALKYIQMFVFKVLWRKVRFFTVARSLRKNAGGLENEWRLLFTVWAVLEKSWQWWKASFHPSRNPFRPSLKAPSALQRWKIWEIMVSSLHDCIVE